MKKQLGIWTMALSLLAIPASAKADHDGDRYSKRQHREETLRGRELARLRTLAIHLDHEVEALYRSALRVDARRGYRHRAYHGDAKRVVKALAKLQKRTHRFHRAVARNQVHRKDALKELRRVEKAFDNARERAQAIAPRRGLHWGFARVGALVERLDRVTDLQVARYDREDRHHRVVHGLRYSWLFGY